MKAIQWAGRALRCSMVLVGCLFGALAVAAPPPVEDYTRRPVIDAVAVSPTGKRLALVVVGGTGYKWLAAD